MKKLTYLSCAAAAVVAVSSCGKAYQPVVTFEEAPDPVVLSQSDIDAWKEVAPGLNGAWADADLRYSRSLVPQIENPVDTLAIAAWKGERASAQLLLWAPEGAQGVECKVADLTSADGATIPADAVTTRFVRYTVSDTLFRVGGPTILSADMLDSLSRFDIDTMTVRPVWVSVNVPRDAAAGMYDTKIVASSVNGGDVEFPLVVEVQDHMLPAPADWTYHLDLWQHPSAVARVRGLKPWSDEHFEALEPMMKRLADAGQKVVTATLNKDPWNHQCYDGYENMINWTLKDDGTWSYDYTVFDRWVSMVMGLGIDKMINCYSMVPWNCELEYFDQKADSMVTVKAEPGTPAFAEMWEPFLLDFKKHLDEKGWLGITNIAMDERSPQQMDAAVKLLEKCAPEMGFAIADNHASYRKYTMMRDVCVSQGQAADHQDIVDRRANGFNTTFYVCCGPAYPNTFTSSHPFEAELLGWYGVALDYDGMLRWAYNSWPADPQYDSRYGTWSSGDTYLVYPYNRSSVRFERLIDGIENAEKIRVLKAEGADLSQVDEVLETIRTTNVNDPNQPWRQITAKARKALEQASRK